MSRHRFATLVVALLAFSSAGLPHAAAYHDDPAVAHAWGDPSFQRTWERTDSPVADGHVQRTWVWGPEPYTDLIPEPYVESPGGLRVTQYSDKSRMEINDPDAPNDSVWYVTNGLLVVEMMDGLLQTGDAAREPHPAGPSTENVAGDVGDDNGPTYADMTTLRDAAPHAPGEVIVAAINASGEVGADDAYLAAGVTAIDVASPTGHTVASVFWEFMNSTGVVWVDGQYQTAPLFQNPLYAVGFPLAEAYWARVRVGGVERDVLLQCFERRCLTYTPGNPAGWEVESGNVGQHYYRWRYGDDGNGNGDPDPDPEPQGARLFTATLEPDAKGGVIDDGPGGRASFFLDDTGQTLRFHLAWHSLANLTVAHIHAGAHGQTGDVIVTLITGAPSNAADDIWPGVTESAQGIIATDLLPPGVTLDDLLEMMAAGEVYVDIHTQTAPDGALRGQVDDVETQDFGAYLSHEQGQGASVENHAANGTATLRYSRSDAALTCTLQVIGLADVIAAHIHLGPVLDDGPAVATLFEGKTGPLPDGAIPYATLTGDDIDIPVVDALNIGGDSLEALVFQMMIGAAHVDVHTSAYPDGDIRGQIIAH